MDNIKIEDDWRQPVIGTLQGWLGAVLLLKAAYWRSDLRADTLFCLSMEGESGLKEFEGRRKADENSGGRGPKQSFTAGVQPDGNAATNEMLRRAGYPCLMDYYAKLH